MRFSILTFLLCIFFSACSQKIYDEPKIPTFLFWLGASSTEIWEESIAGNIDLPGIHSPYFAPDPKPTLKTGINAMTAAAMGVFNGKK